MKKLLFFLLLPLGLQAYQKPAATANEVTVICKIVGAPANSQYIALYEQVGLGYREVARGPLQADNSFLLKAPASKPRMYHIGFNETMNGRIILGEEKQLTLYANAEYMEKGRTTGSPANKALEDMLKRVGDFRATGEQLRNDLRLARNGGNNEGAQAISTQLAGLDKQKSAYLDSLKTANPLLWRSAALQLSPDYYNGRTGYTDELDFYSKEFFSYAKLGDPAFEETPDVTDAFQNYVSTLSQLGANAATTKQMAEAQLAKLNPGSKAYRRALSGITSAFKAANHPDYHTFAKKYVDTYRANDLGDIAKLEFDLKKTSTFTPGMEAPDLVGNTPEGDSYALSKMRGKYVLIDFWASWCGPCRRENPNVVNMYKKYNSKGFEILGVSLDRDAEAWKKAIAQDGLSWKHISDLKGWSSEHAKLYSVSSIPQTLLLDKEGKIIQRNLRGEQLGEKLREIFGE